MQNAKDRHDGISAAIRHAAMLASICVCALAMVSMPVGVDGSGFVLKPAFAASEGSNAGGNGKGNGPEGAPGQQKEELGLSDDLGADDAASEMADETGAGDDPVDSALLPIAEDVPANAKVIKEIAGLSEDSELSEEEELEAIRSGWGTWRTADGPESVIAQ